MYWEDYFVVINWRPLGLCSHGSICWHLASRSEFYMGTPVVSSDISIGIRGLFMIYQPPGITSGQDKIALGPVKCTVL